MKKLIGILIFLGLSGTLHSQAFRFGTQNIGLQAGLGLNLIWTEHFIGELNLAISTEDNFIVYPAFYYYPLPWLYGKTVIKTHTKLHGEGVHTNGDYVSVWVSLGLGIGAEKRIKDSNWKLYGEILGLKNFPIIDSDNIKLFPCISVGVKYLIIELDE